MNGRLKVTDIRPDSISSEKYGFEPFGTLAGVLSGEPVKIMPLGKFFRDERVLDITEADLQEIALNFNAKLPRFRVPINENHQTDGKIGTVKAVEFRRDGADGAGLYASLDLTDDGKDLLQRGRYDAVSPEMVWQKNGASYQDPQTGKRFSNVLVGLAVCDKPFFSHEHVALFTAFPDQYRDFSPDERKALADSGKALPDGSYPIVTVGDLLNAIQAVGRATNRAQVMAHIKKRARALGAEDRLPPEWMADNQALFHAQHDQSTHGHGGGGSAESNTQELPAHAQKDIERGLWTEKEARIANDPSQSREERARAFKNREVTQAAAHTSYRDGNSVKGVLDQEISSGAIKLERSGTRTYLTNPNTGTQLPLKLPVEREYASVALSRQGFANKLETDSMTDIQPGDMPMDKPKRHNGYTKLRELMKAKFDELMAMVKDEDGDGELDMPDMPAAKTMGSHPAADRAAAIIKGVDDMATEVDKNKGAPPAVETFTLTAEQMADFQASKMKAEALAAQVAAQTTQLDTFAAQLATEKRAHRLGEWRQTVKETFTALGVKVDEMAEKFLAIEEQSPELAKYFVDLLKQADTAMAQASLFGQVTHTGGGSGNVESFADLADKILADKYDGDTSKVSLAQAEARKQRPDLFREYQMSYSPRSKRG